jgi:CRISPR/Cas system-associated exonuclease Cas4 (RecB family)
MNEYKKRNSNWNFGGRNWKLSRSKIDLFVECPRCFWLDNKKGIRRPGMPSFNLNSAVDELLKREFDKCRAEGKPHPLMTENGINAVPMQHKEIDTWREVFEGVQIQHEPTGFTISGAIDDLWVNKDGEVFVVDYKSTSKDDDVTLDDRWKEGYKRQMEVYQWLLRQKGLRVSDTGYFVYANATKDRDSFDARLDFKMTILPYEGDTEWIEPTVMKIKETLDSNIEPQPGPMCEHCAFEKMKNEG